MSVVRRAEVETKIQNGVYQVTVLQISSHLSRECSAIS